ncbi:MAG: HEAT repeat domain-containing protein [Ignavibacteriaceae bacterium]|nr:HEAT repeat domain-containing protein [Ignavibacteriaceae bacterium]
MFVIRILPLLLLIVLGIQSFAQLREIKPDKKFPTSFAIIVDEMTYSNCESSILKYKESVEQDGISTYVLVDSWAKPDEIKAEIIRLYNQKPPLEGVVFIGDVPIPMLRNGQHFTSAFKLDEDKYPWFRSSVPSDRFYEDFDLKFEYLGQDSIHRLSHYYSFLPESPQRIEKEIYSARIKPSGTGINKYDEISKYLNRITEQKKQKNYLNNALVYLGHGYLSNSLTAWADEKISLREQFPQLFQAEGRMKNLFHSMNDEMKEIILTELQNEDLDMALFHAHGDTDMQLILAYPIAQNVNENIEAIKLYLRSKLRTAQKRKQSLEETKKYFIKEFDVPESWFDGTFEDSLVVADSILAYKLDIYLDDIRKIKPQAKFIMFDECFNGSFHLDEYVAGEYVFGKGNVVASEANSVNVLQDKWADELLGLLNLGVRIGIRHKELNTLESHLIGDPTFRYSVNFQMDLNEKIILHSNNVELWRSLLKNDNAEVRSIAVRYMFKNLKSKFENELTEIYLNDVSYNVRMNALKCLAELNNAAFHEVLKKSINDPFELIRRKTAEWMGEIGLKEYLPYLVEQIIVDESPRVTFNGKSSLTFISSSLAKEESKKYVNELPEIASKDGLIKELCSSFERSDEWLYKEIIPNIISDTLKLKSKLQEVRTFRNYKFVDAIPFLLDQLINNNNPDSLRSYIAEALGWFTFYYDKGKIIDSLNEILESAVLSNQLRKEVLRTKNRLVTGSNDVMLP